MKPETINPLWATSDLLRRGAKRTDLLVAQMHYARQRTITQEMEIVDGGKNLRAEICADVAHARMIIPATIRHVIRRRVPPVAGSFEFEFPKAVS